MHTKKLLIGLASLSILGCSSSGPVPMGKDTYLITKSRPGTIISISSLKADIYKEANAFCHSEGKEFQPVRENTDDQSAEIQFRCLAKGDLEIQRPNIQRAPDIVIERK